MTSLTAEDKQRRQGLRASVSRAQAGRDVRDARRGRRGGGDRRRPAAAPGAAASTSCAAGRTRARCGCGRGCRTRSCRAGSPARARDGPRARRSCRHRAPRRTPRPARGPRAPRADPPAASSTPPSLPCKQCVTTSPGRSTPSSSGRGICMSITCTISGRSTRRPPAARARWPGAGPARPSASRPQLHPDDDVAVGLDVAAQSSGEAQRRSSSSPTSAEIIPSTATCT